MADPLLDPPGCYVYLVWRPTGEPLYIGKGSGERWRRHKARAKSNPHYAGVLRKTNGNLPVSVLLCELTEEEALVLETAFTHEIGIESEGGPLVNAGHGGRGGPSGVKHSREFRERRREIQRALWQDPSYRALALRPDRRRSGNTQPRTPEFKVAVAEKLKGNTHTLGYRHTEASKIKMGLAHAGVRQTPEHIAKRTSGQKGRKHSAEHTAKVRAALAGRVASAEQIEAIKAGLQRRKAAGLPIGHPRKHELVEKSCAWCGKSIVTRETKMCCSTACSNRYRAVKR